MSTIPLHTAEVTTSPSPSAAPSLPLRRSATPSPPPVVAPPASTTIALNTLPAPSPPPTAMKETATAADPSPSLSLSLPTAFTRSRRRPKEAASSDPVVVAAAPSQGLVTALAMSTVPRSTAGSRSTAVDLSTVVVDLAMVSRSMAVDLIIVGNLALEDQAMVNLSMEDLVTLNPSMVDLVTLNPSMVDLVTLNLSMVDLVTLNPSMVNLDTLNPSMVNLDTLNPSMVDRGTEGGLSGKRISRPTAIRTPPSPTERRVNKALAMVVAAVLESMALAGVAMGGLRHMAMNQSQATISPHLMERKKDMADLNMGRVMTLMMRKRRSEIRSITTSAVMTMMMNETCCWCVSAHPCVVEPRNHTNI